MDSSDRTGPTEREPEGWPHICATTPASAELPTGQRVPSSVVDDTPPLPMSEPDGGREQQTSGTFISPSPGTTTQNRVQTLAALYQSSRRSRNNTPLTGVKPNAPIAFPPAPPLYYQKNGRESDNQTTITSSAGAGSSSILTGSIDIDTAAMGICGGLALPGLGDPSRSMSKSSAEMAVSMQTERPARPLTTYDAAQPSHNREDSTPVESQMDDYTHSHRDTALTVPSLSSGSAETDMSEILTGKFEGVELGSSQTNGASLKRSPPLELNAGNSSEPPKKKCSILREAMSDQSDEITPATPAMAIKSDVSFDIMAYPSSRVSTLPEIDSPIPEDLLRDENEGATQDIEFQMQLKRDESLEAREREREERIVRRKIQRLLLIKHCSTCRHQILPMEEIRVPPSSDPVICKSCDEAVPEYTASTKLDVCPVTWRCAEGKALCAHIRTCKLSDCRYKRCITSREVLGHYMSCKDRACRICEPVRHKESERKNCPPEEVDIMRRSSSLETNDLWIENEQW